MLYLFIAFLILFDQFTKLLIIKDFFGYPPWEVLPFFNIVLVFNKGISFSILSTDSHLMPYGLAIVALAICYFLIKWIQHENNTGIRIGLAMIIGGALGNALDRFFYGAVVDFLDFHIKGYHWPAFNMADTFICLGAAWIIYRSIFKPQKH